MTDRIGADSPLGELDPAGAVRPLGARPTPVPSPSNGAGHRHDRVDISSRAVQMNRAREAVDAAPETRAALVERLRREVADGTYQVDARALAERLLPVLLSGRFDD